MEDDEHEVYGQEIPVDGEDVDMAAAGDDAAKVRSAPSPCRRFLPSSQIPTLTLTPVLTLLAYAAAGARRDEASAQGDGGGGRRPPRDAGQGRQGDARLVPSPCTLPFVTMIRSSSRVWWLGNLRSGVVGLPVFVAHRFG